MEYVYQMRADGIINRHTVIKETPKTIIATAVVATYETPIGPEEHTDRWTVPKSVLGICPPPAGGAAWFASEEEAYEAAVPYLERTVEAGKTASALLKKILRKKKGRPEKSRK